MCHGFLGLDLTHVCFLSVDQSQNVQRRGGEGRKKQVVVCQAIFEVVVCLAIFRTVRSL